MRIVSWNLLHHVGAQARDVASLIEACRPDVMLMQEATEEIGEIAHLCGGWYYRAPMARRTYGLAAWSRHRFDEPATLRLPASKVPGRVPPRLAQMVRIEGVTLANVHLSHGQMLNRLQLRHITRHLVGPAAIIGDYNALGPIRLAGFHDVGPRQVTCRASGMIPFRLDRCMVRGMERIEARVLWRGPSDHHPIMLTLRVGGAR